VRHLHWHWPPGIPPTSSVVPVLIVIALLVVTWAVRHHALLNLFHRPEPRRQAADRVRVPSPSFSDESLRLLLDQDAITTTTRQSQANQSPQRV